MAQQPEQPATNPLLTKERDQADSNVPIDSKQTLDAGEMNLYSSSKTLALGFADTPLLVTNINQIIKAAVMVNKFSSVIITLAALSVGVQLVTFVILVILWFQPLHGTNGDGAPVNKLCKALLLTIFCSIFFITLLNIALVGVEQYTTPRTAGHSHRSYHYPAYFKLDGISRNSTR